jgi:isoleucyl-tRNA synthetase
VDVRPLGAVGSSARRSSRKDSTATRISSSATGYRNVRKIGEMTEPGPSGIYILLDEHENSINDAHYFPFSDLNRYNRNPWLDAGIVSFSTLRYRSDHEYWQQWYPADWISESFPGQFRNWFYSLLVMSTVMENREPFKAVFTYATLVDEHGKPMHKSSGNMIEFREAAEKMGVDVMRWMYCRNAPETNMLFGYNKAEETRRQFFILSGMSIVSL